ncbi:MAG TPA: protein translocase subunit SecD [Dehalococcoidia bacterium]|nr:protein translocase subunit SecD [Dehalococcoidia bacterium]
MNRRSLLLALTIILTVFSFIVVWPSDPDRYLPDFFPWPKGHGLEVGGFERRAMRLGLDLRGGTRLLLEADTSALPADADADQAIEGAKNIIERRVDAFGVADAEITRQGQSRLAVQIPGLEPEKARNLIGRTALLEFREVQRDPSGNVLCTGLDGSAFAVPFSGQTFFFSSNIGLWTCTTQVSQEAAAPPPPELQQLLEEVFAGQPTPQPAPAPAATPAPETVTVVGFPNWVPAEGVIDGERKPLTGRYLLPRSRVAFESITQQPRMQFELNDEGARLFQQITTRLVNWPLGIFLDEEIISAPTVNSPISKQGEITGLTLKEAQELARLLNIGALPIPFQVIQEQAVDATLGSDSVQRSVQAGEIGILAVMLFMILYYRMPGVLASLALVVYASTLLMIFKLLPVTLTLAGIAAFVLSVGVAVDANILIFERLKEELRAGRSLRSALDLGFSRAWSSIRDSNVSTLITCGILYWFGNQFGAALVKGFALTLAIGVMISMFSAILVTRTFMELALSRRWARQRNLYGVALAGGEGWLSATPTGPRHGGSLSATAGGHARIEKRQR